jgi:protein-disulfide isomerase
MFRRFLVKFSRRAFVLCLAVCLGCAAQLAPPELARRIEHHVRAQYNIPTDVQIQVGAPRSSEFPNYSQLTVTFVNGEKKQNYEFLLSQDQKTLYRLTKFDLSSDPYSEVMKKIDVQNRPTRGNKSAKVTVVNYDDFQCPYCSRMHQTLFPALLNEYGDRVLFVYKDFPLVEIHPWASHAALDANCLFAQNNDAYWSLADYLHANQRDINNDKNTDVQFARLDQFTMQQGQKFNLDLPKLLACVKEQKSDKLKESMHEGQMLGIEATPTLYVNGTKVDGAYPIDDLRKIFDRALQEAGVTPPLHPAAAASGTAQPAPPSK